MVHFFGHHNKTTSLEKSRNSSPAERKEDTSSGDSNTKQIAYQENKDSEKNDDVNEESNEDIKKKLNTPKVKGETFKADDQTMKNTRFNASLYHTSNDSVNLYRQENNSSDLLGRLYYDDYDSDTFGSEVGSPMLSPNGAASPTEYFQSNIGSPTLSSTNLSALLNSQRRPNLNKVKSFERGISFDTSTNDHRKSLTLKIKHSDFKFRRNNKTFLAGYNNDTVSLKAIQWLLEELIINGDTIVILQVLDEKLYDCIDKAKAERQLNKIEAMNCHSKKVSLVYEVVIGKPQKLLKKAIDEYEPAMMIIGTHHFKDKDNSAHPHTRSHLKLISKTSMSKHFLECALVPVIVVKPTHHYVEKLDEPIESELYFQNLISKIDTKTEPLRDKHKKRSRLHLLSPLTSRSSSFTNLAAMGAEKEQATDNLKVEDRGRKETLETSTGEGSLLLPTSRSSSRSTSRSGSRLKSKGFSKFFH